MKGSKIVLDAPLLARYSDRKVGERMFEYQSTSWD